MIGCSSKMLPSLETLDTNVGIAGALDALRPNVIRSRLMAELIRGSRTSVDKFTITKLPFDNARRAVKVIRSPPSSVVIKTASDVVKFASDNDDKLLFRTLGGSYEPFPNESAGSDVAPSDLPLQRLELHSHCPVHTLLSPGVCKCLEHWYRPAERSGMVRIRLSPTETFIPRRNPIESMDVSPAQPGVIFTTVSFRIPMLGDARMCVNG